MGRKPKQITIQDVEKQIKDLENKKRLIQQKENEKMGAILTKMKWQIADLEKLVTLEKELNKIGVSLKEIEVKNMLEIVEKMQEEKVELVELNTI